jgi:low affinity Fe/Cu permease
MAESKWWAVFLAVVTIEILLLIKLLTSQATIELLIAIAVVTILLVLTLRIQDINNLIINKDGIEARLSERISKVAETVETKVDELGNDINNLLISTVLDAYEYITLKKIAGEEQNGIYDFTYPKGRDLLERLRNRGLIDELSSNTIFKDENNGKRINVRDHFSITERGKNYLKALNQKGLDKSLDEILKQGS